MTLRATLDAAAHAAATTAMEAEDGGLTWVLADRVFATLDARGAVASFRLDPVLAAAARRTPDTRASERGDAWVTFAPSTMDGPAVDRATAWFAAAVRRAREG